MSEYLEMNKELEIYKLFTKTEIECGWVSDDEFYAWIYLHEIAEFIKNIKNIIGDYIFQDDGIQVRLINDYICLNLTDIIEDEVICLERVFPKNEFKH